MLASFVMLEGLRAKRRGSSASREELQMGLTHGCMYTICVWKRMGVEECVVEAAQRRESRWKTSTASCS